MSIICVESVVIWQVSDMACRQTQLRQVTTHGDLPVVTRIRDERTRIHVVNLFCKLVIKVFGDIRGMELLSATATAVVLAPSKDTAFA